MEAVQPARPAFVRADKSASTASQPDQVDPLTLTDKGKTYYGKLHRRSSPADFTLAELPTTEYEFLKFPPVIYSGHGLASSFDGESINTSLLPSTAATTPHATSGAGTAAVSTRSARSSSAGPLSREPSPRSSLGPHHGTAAPKHRHKEAAESSASDSSPYVAYTPHLSAVNIALSADDRFVEKRPRRKIVKKRPRRRPFSRHDAASSEGESESEEDVADDQNRLQVQDQLVGHVQQQQQQPGETGPGVSVDHRWGAEQALALKRSADAIQTLNSELQRHGKRRITRQKWMITLGLVLVNFILIFATWWWPRFYYIYLPPIALPLALNCCMIVSITITQLFRYAFSKTSRRSAAVAPANPETFIMLMPCYNETVEECTRSLESLTTQDGISHHPRAILVICDGKVRGPGMEKTTAEYLQQDILTQTAEPMRLIRNAYGAWDGGSMDVEVTRGWFRGVPFYCIVKCENQGKRDSLIVARSFSHKFNQRRQNPHTIFGREFLTDITEWLEHDAGIDHVDHLIGMDADTVFDKGCILELLTQMRLADAQDAASLKRSISRKQRKARRDPEKSGTIVTDDINDPEQPRTVGVCGFVAVDFSAGRFSPWHLYQNTEYTIAQGLRRLHQSIITCKVSCLPGCCQLLRVCETTCGDRVLVELFGYHPKALDGMLKRIRATASEDRNHVCLMLTEFPAARTRQALFARAYTDVPRSWSVFLSQRRRWTLGATSNDLLLLTAWGTQWWERILALSNVVVWTLNVFVIASIASMIVACLTQPVWVTMCFVSVMLIPITYYLLMTLWLPRTMLEKTQFLLGLVEFVIFGPFINISVMIYAVWNMNSFGWGKTRRIITDDVDNGDKAPDMSTSASASDAEAGEGGQRMTTAAPQPVAV